MNSGLSLVGNLINCETSNEETGSTLSCHRKIASEIFISVQLLSILTSHSTVLLIMHALWLKAGSSHSM